MKFARIALLFSLIGPGILTAIGDNDVGGIASNSAAGAHYGYSFLWVLFIITIALTVVLDMCARMGIVTGKGLMELIRENFGVKWTAVVVLGLCIANAATTISNFAGLVGGMEIFGINKFIFIPLIALITWYLVSKGTYKVVEKSLMAISLVVLSYIGSALLAKPDWSEVARNTFVPSVKFNGDYLMLMTAFVGTTIAPWMLFFIQSSIVDKGISVKHINVVRAEVWISSFLTDYAISFFIIIACAATMHKYGIRINDVPDAALALRPLAGQFSSLLFAVGIIASALLAIFLLPLTTAYAVCEAFGFQSGLNKSRQEAPVFYNILALFIATGAIFVLIPKIPLFPLIIIAQVVAGIITPILLVFILLLVNNKQLMQEYSNKKIFNILSMATVAWIIAIVILYIWLTIRGQ